MDKGQGPCDLISFIIILMNVMQNITQLFLML